MIAIMKLFDLVCWIDCTLNEFLLGYFQVKEMSIGTRA